MIRPKSFFTSNKDAGDAGDKLKDHIYLLSKNPLYLHV
jgi:hypothetical protein